MLNIAIMGFGTVGSGIAEVISGSYSLVKSRLGDDINIKRILDLRDFPDSPYANRVTHDFNDILGDDSVTVVAETMGGCGAAYKFTKALLEAGKSVVTSNKELVAAHGVELLRIAGEHGAHYLFEGSVGGGIPLIRPMNDSLAHDDITEITGILNGTTNFILSQMGSGMSFDEALAEAKRLGYAECDPTADIDGHDACRKICILAAVAFGVLIPSGSVHCRGIRGLMSEDIAAAAEKNRAVKLIARAKRLPDGKIEAEVAPYEVVMSSPLYSVEGVFNGVLLHGTMTGDVMFYGRGAGSLPTASAVVADIIECGSKHSCNKPQRLWEEGAGLYAAPESGTVIGLGDRIEI
jgi:homoserine dehydrogenase